MKNMRHFFTLYGYELKKISKRKMVWITMAVVIFLAVFIGCGDIFSSRSIHHGQEKVVMTGLEYQRYEKKNKMKLNGKAIDDILLKETREAYQRIHTLSYEEQEQGGQDASSFTMVVGSFDGDMEKAKEFARKRDEYEAIYHYIVDSTGKGEAIYTIDEKRLYTARHSNLVFHWIALGMTQEEIEYWEKKEAMLETPFTYEYAEGWERIIKAVYSLCFTMGIAIACCLANVFSEEHMRKTDQLILCSRYGKRICYFAKVAAGITFGIVSGGISLFVTSITILMLYGAEGKDAIIQILFPLCSRNMTVGQVVVMFVTIYLIICLLWSILTLFLSESTKNGVAVMGIMSGGIFLSMILDIPDSFRVLSQICELHPVRLVSPWQLWDNRLVRIFGVYLDNYEAASMLYLLICVLLVFMGKHIYENYQVRGR